MAKGKSKDKESDKPEAPKGDGPGNKNPTGPDLELVEATAARVSEMIEPMLQELEKNQSQLRESSADAVEHLTTLVEKIDANQANQPQQEEEWASVRMEAVAARVAEMLGPVLQELENQHEQLRQASIEAIEAFKVAIVGIEARQEKVDGVLRKLSEEYAAVAAATETDWRVIAGKEYEEAEAATVKASRKRRELMKKLAIYEQEHTDAHARGADVKYAALCAECNEAADEVAKARVNSRKIKDAAMQRVAG